MAKEFNVRIDNIEIIEKSIYKVKEFNTSEFEHTISTQTKINHQGQIIITFVNSVVKSIPDGIPLANLTVAIGFLVENFADEFFSNGEPINEINSDLDNHFKSIVISTLRGIMFSEFRGTRLHRAILPIILIKDLKPAPPNVQITE